MMKYSLSELGRDVGGKKHGTVAYLREIQPSAAAERDELVSLAGHGRHDDGDLMAGIDLPLHMRGDIADPIEVGDRGAAEFHHQSSHFPTSFPEGREPRCER